MLVLETNFLDMLQRIHTPILDKIMVFISSLGNSGWFFIALGVVLLCLKKYRRVGICILFALLLCLITGNLILKPLVARPRPCWVNPVTMLIPIPKDYSFPSGHTYASFAAATVLFLSDKRAGILAYILAVCIAFSRMYLYVHYPTDVLAGLILGVTAGIVSHYLGNRICGHKHEV